MINNLRQLEHVSFRVSVSHIGYRQHVSTVTFTVGHYGDEACVPLTSVGVVRSSRLFSSLIYLRRGLGR